MDRLSRLEITGLLLAFVIVVGCSSSNTASRTAADTGNGQPTVSDQNAEVGGATNPVVTAGGNLILASGSVVEACVGGSCATKRYSVQLKNSKGKSDILNSQTFNTYRMTSVEWRFAGEYSACKEAADNAYVRICEAKSGAILTMTVEVTLKSRDRPDGVVGSNQGHILSDPSFDSLYIFASRDAYDGILSIPSVGTGVAAADSLCGSEVTHFPSLSISRVSWYALQWTSARSLHSHMQDDGFGMSPILTFNSAQASNFVFNRDVFALNMRSNNPVSASALFARAGESFVRDGVSADATPTDWVGMPTSQWRAWLGQGCMDWLGGSSGVQGGFFGATGIGSASNSYNFSTGTQGCNTQSRILCLGVPNM